MKNINIHNVSHSVIKGVPCIIFLLKIKLFYNLNSTFLYLSLLLYSVILTVHSQELVLLVSKQMNLLQYFVIHLYSQYPYVIILSVKMSSQDQVLSPPYCNWPIPFLVFTSAFLSSEYKTSFSISNFDDQYFVCSSYWTS